MPYPSQCFAKAAIAQPLECIHIETISRSYVWAEGFFKGTGVFSHIVELFPWDKRFFTPTGVFHPEEGVFHQAEEFFTIAHTLKFTG